MSNCSSKAAALPSAPQRKTQQLAHATVLLREGDLGSRTAGGASASYRPVLIWYASYGCLGSGSRSNEAR
jgi:hypothetical protein